jgi:CRP-like cAMP-binding protein
MVKPLDRNDSDDAAKYDVSGKAGDFIFREGDHTFEMYIIQDGEIEITRAYAGEERQLAHLEVGDFFGEASLFDDQPREASAHALTDYRLLRIDHSTFGGMVQDNPEIAVRMMRKLSRRLREREDADLRAALIASGAITDSAAGEREAGAASPMPASGSEEGVLHHGPSGTEYALSKEAETTVGRRDRVTGITPDVDLTERDKERTLSRSHAKIVKRDDGYCVFEDIGTSNGTFVNDERVPTGTQVPLKAGDRVRFGAVELVFQTR